VSCTKRHRPPARGPTRQRSREHGRQRPGADRAMNPSRHEAPPDAAAAARHRRRPRQPGSEPGGSRHGRDRAAARGVQRPAPTAGPRDPRRRKARSTPTSRRLRAVRARAVDRSPAAATATDGGGLDHGRPVAAATAAKNSPFAATAGGDSSGAASRARPAPGLATWDPRALGSAGAGTIRSAWVAIPEVGREAPGARRRELRHERPGERETEVGAIEEEVIEPSARRQARGPGRARVVARSGSSAREDPLRAQAAERTPRSDGIRPRARAADASIPARATAGPASRCTPARSPPAWWSRPPFPG
jgi:hypothetical protein